MKKRMIRTCPAAIISCLLMAMAVFAGDVPPGSGMDDLVDLTAPPEGWISTEPPRTAAGNQLFTVINGGAEMYVRLGFSRAVFAAYRSPAGRDINLEVYQMKTTAAAGKAQALKAGAGGRAVAFGEAARLADYYLNFYKGTYQVTISGYDTDRQTVAAILALAGRIEPRLAVP